MALHNTHQQLFNDRVILLKRLPTYTKLPDYLAFQGFLNYTNDKGRIKNVSSSVYPKASRQEDSSIVPKADLWGCNSHILSFIFN